MLRSSLLLAVLLGILATCGRAAVAADRLDAGTIKAALRTATPAEGAFVDRVVELMAQKKLPRSLVQSTFQWARRKSHHQFQYFRRGLLIRAARLGIRL